MVTATITTKQMIDRLVDATFALRAGKKVVMKPGTLRASGWSAKQVIKFLLKELDDCERYLDSGVVWKVWITRRPDHTLVVEGSCKS